MNGMLLPQGIALFRLTNALYIWHGSKQKNLHLMYFTIAEGLNSPLDVVARVKAVCTCIDSKNREENHEYWFIRKPAL